MCQPRARQAATRPAARPWSEPARGTAAGSGHRPPGARRTFTCSFPGSGFGGRSPS
ncbi:conserved domain protein [Actinomyces sp. oral taxon 170 str. F0386]|nr:conserved domain protein [Actinomyces sp. oral taxon 170 str. F0386]